ncbi:FkbM family methyltransferase [Limobrevibacterium gyesilva]|uniref:FkbM family methyltransferase n=1 Tax=Limobrevibacterium gyesilva TaxID=2991712 RepID=A0AA42CFG2_9PROT|nr:FkbM family methyltransferase [Limobrevibacterium gyesilva]MCW3476584.1 FkbM family methyltransferase [Limobrevibacterium gyesilva]
MTGSDSPPPAIAPADATGPGSSSTLQQDLLRKMEMEAAMVAAPQDKRLRAAYFDMLIGFAGVRTGLSQAMLPELGHPLYFRCGSTDVINLAQIFRDGAYAFPMRATPARILDLGAYAGYAAVYLACRFPAAEIACAGPCPGSFRLLTLNTTPYRNIRAMNLAAWHSNTRLGVAARYFGDWGTQLQDQMPDADRTLPACTVGEILRRLGWDQVDFVKCDIEGSERAVFADSSQRWLHTLDVLAIETHDTIAAGCSEAVANCFDPAFYEHARHGEADLYQRRIPFRALPNPPPRTVFLINSEPGLFPIALQDVAQKSWGFFTFDGDSCQLHPNGAGERPARVIFPRTLDGHTRFVATLHHAGNPAAAVRFTVIVEREDGGEILRAEHALAARESHAFTVGLPALTGRHRIILQTEMAPGAPHNFNAWARWIAPRVA